MRPGRNYLVPIMYLVDFIGSIIFFRKRKTADVKSILILQPANFGDVVVTLPTIKGFKEAFPEAKVDVLVKKNMQELLNHLNKECMLAGRKFYIGKAYYLEEDWMPTNGRLPIKSVWKFTKTKLYKNLKSNRYDLIVDVHGDPRNIFLMFLLRGKLRIGFSIRGLGFLLTHKAKFDPDAHIIDRYFETVKAFSDMKLPTDLGFAKWENHQQNKVVIHPGTGLSIKQWSVEGWANVADEIIKKGKEVILTYYSRDEFFEVEKIRSLMEYSNLCQIKQVYDVSDMVDLLAKCKLFISPDTGPAHLAHMMEVPQIQLFGPSMAKRWGYENVCSIECECVNELECKYGFENRCMLKLKPEVVIMKIEEVLNGT